MRDIRAASIVATLLAMGSTGTTNAEVSTAPAASNVGPGGFPTPPHWIVQPLFLPRRRGRPTPRRRRLGTPKQSRARRARIRAARRSR